MRWLRSRRRWLFLAGCAASSTKRTKDTGKRLAELGAHLADVVELVQDTWKASAPETNAKNHVSIV
jgi:hypothetical protein